MWLGYIGLLNWRGKERLMKNTSVSHAGDGLRVNRNVQLQPKEGRGESLRSAWKPTTTGSTSSGSPSLTPKQLGPEEQIVKGLSAVHP